MIGSLSKIKCDDKCYLKNQLEIAIIHVVIYMEITNQEVSELLATYFMILDIYAQRIKLITKYIIQGISLIVLHIIHESI
jgi:hypothetical protein